MAYRHILNFFHGVFDVDGTIVDSVRGCNDIYRATLQPHGIDDSLDSELATALTSARLVDRYKAVFAQHGRPITELESLVLREDYERRFLAADYPLCDGAEALLSTLAALGVVLFASSAASDAVVWKRIARSSLGKHFKLAYGSTVLPKGPAHIEAFAKVAGMPVWKYTHEAFMCGDSVSDMLIAKSAGLYAIGVRGTVSDEKLTAAGADRLVDSLAELLAEMLPPA